MRHEVTKKKRKKNKKILYIYIYIYIKIPTKITQHDIKQKQIKTDIKTPTFYTI